MLEWSAVSMQQGHTSTSFQLKLLEICAGGSCSMSYDWYDDDEPSDYRIDRRISIILEFLNSNA